MNQRETPAENAGEEISSLAEQIDAEVRRDRQRADASIHEEAQDAIAKVQSRQRLLFILVTVFIILTGINLAGLSPFTARPPAPTAEELRLSALADVEMMVDDLEEWRIAQGRLPATLDEVAEAGEGWSYDPTDEAGYRITRMIDGVTVTYKSSEDPDEFFAALYEPQEE